MKKLGLAAMLLIGVCLLAGCGAGKRLPAQYAQSSEAVYHGEEVTPEELADQITVESIVPYDGIFLEGEEKERVEDIYALRLTNVSEKTILYATLTYRAGNRDLTFYVEMLPKGMSVIVGEQNKRQAEKKDLKFVDGDIHYIKDGLESMESVEIVPTGLSTLNVKNMTKEMLPVVWIFYRKAEDDGTLLGGRCYSTGIVNLGGREKFEAEAEYWMDDCVIVNVLLPDSLDLNIDAENHPETETDSEP